jgi:hypothetical protein
MIALTHSDLDACNVNPQPTWPELSLAPPISIEDRRCRKPGRPKASRIAPIVVHDSKQHEQVLLGDAGVVKKRRPVGRPRKQIPLEVPLYSIALGDGRVVRIFFIVAELL